MYTALLFVPKNSVLLFDESSAHLSSRVGHGVAVSSFAESNLNTRKKNCIMVYMSAHDWEIAPAIRRNCREVWMPVSGKTTLRSRPSAAQRAAGFSPPTTRTTSAYTYQSVTYVPGLSVTHVPGRTYPYRKANLIESESYRLKQSRLAATTRSAGDFPELHEAVRDALRLGAVSFDAVKHLVLCRVEGRPPETRSRSLLAVIQQAYVEGVSTRRVDDLVKALGCEGISKSQVSRICQELDVVVDGFLGQSGRAGPEISARPRDGQLQPAGQQPAVRSADCAVTGAVRGGGQHDVDRPVVVRYARRICHQRSARLRRAERLGPLASTCGRPTL